MLSIPPQTCVSVLLSCSLEDCHPADPLSFPCAPLFCPQAAVLLSQLTPTKCKGQFPALCRPCSVAGSPPVLFSLFLTSGQPQALGSPSGLSRPPGLDHCASALPASLSSETECDWDRLTTNGSGRLGAKFGGPEVFLLQQQSLFPLEFILHFQPSSSTTPQRLAPLLPKL